MSPATPPRYPLVVGGARERGPYWMGDDSSASRSQSAADAGAGSSPLRRTSLLPAAAGAATGLDERVVATPRKAQVDTWDGSGGGSRAGLLFDGGRQLSSTQPLTYSGGSGKDGLEGSDMDEEWLHDASSMTPPTPPLRPSLMDRVSSSWPLSNQTPPQSPLPISLPTPLSPNPFLNDELSAAAAAAAAAATAATTAAAAATAVAAARGIASPQPNSVEKRPHHHRLDGRGAGGGAGRDRGLGSPQATLQSDCERQLGDTQPIIRLQSPSATLLPLPSPMLQQSRQRPATSPSLMRGSGETRLQRVHP